MNKPIAVGLLCAVLAGCGTMHTGTTPRDGRTDSGRAAAIADAHRLLGLIVLPAGAIRSSSAPTAGLGQPAQRVATPNLVDAHAWWRVKGTMTGVNNFIEAHAPQGSTGTGNGSSETRGTVVSLTITFSWPVIRGVLGERSLVVEVVPLPHGYAGVRADAEVVWTQPKPAGERVPAAARVLKVSEAFPARKPMLTFTTTNASKVHKLAAMLDGLPIVQPGMFNCPAMLVSPTVTFTFRARRGGRALAQASMPSTGPDFECPGISFTVGGRAEPGLSAPPSFLAAVSRVLGVTLLTK